MPRQQRAGKRSAGKPGGTSATSVEVENDGGEPNHPPAGSKRPAPGLHVVATPIGNADDITLRALAVLRGADAIACEDTRVTAKLLARHGIAMPLVAYHDHNAERMRPALLERAAPRRGRRAGLRCRHAAGLRSRLQAGARRDRRGPAGDDAARPVGGAGGAGAVGPADATAFSSPASCRPSRRRGGATLARARRGAGDARLLRGRLALGGRAR